MADNNDNGGSAFPIIDVHSRWNDSSRSYEGVETTTEASGMSLRDWFAGHAASGLIASFSGESVPSPPPTFVAVQAYAYADAMLAERQKAK